jgi:hypothetical protein
MAKVCVMVQDDSPMQLQWKQVVIAISDIVDHWWETGRWWKDETACAFYLVATAQGLFLLCRNPKANEWYAKPVC